MFMDMNYELLFMTVYKHTPFQSVNKYAGTTYYLRSKVLMSFYGESSCIERRLEKYFLHRSNLLSGKDQDQNQVAQ